MKQTGIKEEREKSERERERERKRERERVREREKELATSDDRVGNVGATVQGGCLPWLGRGDRR